MAGKDETVTDDTRHLWLAIRQALLMIVDAIERYVLGTEPRTSELRKQGRQP
jgi:hypothetical protein